MALLQFGVLSFLHTPLSGRLMRTPSYTSRFIALKNPRAQPFNFALAWKPSNTYSTENLTSENIRHDLQTQITSLAEFQ